MSMKNNRWTADGTSRQIFSYKGERLFYVAMVDGWHNQITPTCERLLAALNATETTVEDAEADAAEQGRR